MRRARTAVLASLAILAGSAGPAAAQTFLMNSAETINQGNFKIAAYPVMLMGEGNADDSWGIGGRFGYGFTRSFDVEATLAAFDGLTLLGADAELWIVKGPVDVSASVGGHLANRDGGPGSKALDLAGIVSGHVSRALELFGGLTASFESLDDVDRDFTRTHFVPGLEYAVAQDLDFLVEFGLGLNDDSHDYLAFGLAYYLR